MTRYQLQWGYCNGGGSTWWLIGMVLGGSLVLVGPLLIQALQNLLYLFVALCILAMPVVGVLVTRHIVRRIEAKKRKVKLRGPLYADYAYILY